MVGVESDETAVQVFARSFEHSHRYVDAGFAQHADASPFDLGKRVHTSHHHAGYAGADN